MLPLFRKLLLDANRGIMNGSMMQFTLTDVSTSKGKEQPSYHVETRKEG